MCPPGVDQTTRTPQQWHILLPLLHRRQALVALNKGPFHRHGTPKDYVESDLGFDAFNKLAPFDNEVTSAKASAALNTVTVRSPSTFKLSPLESLPAELLANILADSELGPYDVLALGVCSSTLWSHVLFHVQQVRHRTAVPFANTPFLCSGTWLTELPPALYELFPRETSVEKVYRLRTRRWFGPCPARRWNWGAVSSYGAVQADDPRSVWMTAFEALAVDNLDVFCQYGLRRSLEALFEPADIRQEKDWVLRDLTAKESVRLELAGSAGSQGVKVHVEKVPSLSLDNALMLRICRGGAAGPGWSGESQKYRDLVSGKWAGHCFDVVQRDDESLESAGYEDVTEQIAKEGSAWEGIGGMEAKDWTKDMRIRYFNMRLTKASETFDSVAVVFVLALRQFVPAQAYAILIFLETHQEWKRRVVKNRYLAAPASSW
ncbi:Uu.00g098010.m01.CDS01 [Anthostomella pinea]|uniref:Uu.00g098010.m01.CDS01 n=1 Tax=Anthostomella pinea TaxID=933095 RepID=A0AAI8VD74_9PEZI|nr:Uu.00g098010.m01.CDS01 [Anthostomella pinea]